MTSLIKLSQLPTGSLQVTNDYIPVIRDNGDTTFSNYRIVTQQFQESLTTASYALSSSYSNTASYSLSSSFTNTASYSNTASYATTASSLVSPYNSLTKIVFDPDGGMTITSPVRISIINTTSNNGVDY